MTPKNIALLLAAIAALLTNLDRALAQTWMQTSAPITNWASVASSADGSKLVAAVLGGPLYTSTNSGEIWTATSAPITNWQAVVCSGDGTKRIAVTDGGPIYISGDSGVTWASASAPATNWAAVACSASGTKVVAAVGGTFAPFSARPPGLIYISTDSGATWSASSAPTANWTSVACSADGSRLLAVTWTGGAAALYVSFDSGTNWLGSSPPITYLVVAACSGDFTTWVAGSSDPFHYGGGGWPIQISTNFGATWTATLSPGPARPSIACSTDGTRWVTASRGSSYGNLGGPIYISSDSARDWLATSSPDTNWSSLASSADGSRLVAAIKGGGIYSWQTLPSLAIVREGTNLVFSWTALGSTADHALQENPDLVQTNWADVQATSSLTNQQYQSVVPAPSGNRFYRLKH